MFSFFRRFVIFNKSVITNQRFVIFNKSVTINPLIYFLIGILSEQFFIFVIFLLFISDGFLNISLILFSNYLYR